MQTCFVAATTNFGLVNHKLQKSFTAATATKFNDVGGFDCSSSSQVENFPSSCYSKQAWVAGVVLDFCFLTRCWT